jgi:O-antigen/teichoic acid export membrane protein
MRPRRKAGSILARNIVYNLAGQGLLLGISVLAARYIFRQLGAEAYGVISFALILNAFVLVALDLGIAATTTREMAMNRERDPDRAVRLIRTATTLFYGFFVLGAVGIWIAAPLLTEHFLRLSSLPATTATLMLRVLGISMLTSLPKGLYTSVLRGIEHMGRTNVIDVGSAAVQQLGVAVILLRGGSLLQVVSWIALSNVVGLLAYAIVVARLFSWRTLLPGFSMVVVRQSRRFSSQMTAISVLSVLHSEADQLIVVKLLPVGTFGYYTFISNLAGKGSLVTAAVSLAALPSIAAGLAREDRSESLRQYRKFRCLAIELSGGHLIRLAV